MLRRPLDSASPATLASPAPGPAAGAAQAGNGAPDLALAAPGDVAAGPPTVITVAVAPADPTGALVPPAVETPGEAAPSAVPVPAADALALPEDPAAPAEPAAAAPAEIPRIDDLGHALALRAPGATAAAALVATLEAWSLPEAAAAAPPLLAFPDLLAALEAHGLGVVALPSADVATLRAIAYPALLVVEAADGVPRVVLLRRIAGDEVELVGVAESGPVRVAADTLERQWSGESWVVWREFEPLPPLLRAGDQGEGVAWLQSALGELGFPAGGVAGVFDEATELAVRAFQADHELIPDGQVGPFTKMSLYRALGRYAAPDVVAQVESGGAG